MAANCCESLAKGIIILFNIVFCITGLFLIGVGAYVQIAAESYLDFLGVSYVNTPIILIVVGVIIFVIAFLGCCGASKENKCMLYTYSTLLTLILLVEIGVGIAAFVLKAELKPEVQKNMKEAQMNYGKEDYEGVTKSWDYLQQNLECCGVDSAADWGNSIPDSCCVEKVDGCGADSNQDKFVDGCLTKFEKHFIDNIHIVGGVALAFAFIQLLGAIFACCIARHSYA